MVPEKLVDLVDVLKLDTLFIVFVHLQSLHFFLWFVDLRIHLV